MTLALPDDWMRPDYAGRGFAAIPGTIERLLTGATRRQALDPDLLPGIGSAERFDRVALVYFDALGWSFVERYAGHPFLAGALASGRAAPIAAQFPSTTAAHVTTIHTGRALPDHGVLEWHCYDPTLDRVVSPLLFGFHDGDPGSLAGALAPEQIFGSTTLFQDLTPAGVATSVHQSAAYATSAPTRALAESSLVVGFPDPERGLAGAAAWLSRPGPAYATVYLDTLDAALHHYGPASAEADAEAIRLLDLVERFAASLPAGTVFLMTADHGQVAVHPDRTTYLNEIWPDVDRHLRRGSDGLPLVPAGSSRDLFLHVLPDRVDEVAERLARDLAGLATVHRVADLVADGWFGRAPSARLLGRLSEILVVPVVGEAVWWHDPPRFVQGFRGNHGGPSREEMEIPLVALIT